MLSFYRSNARWLVGGFLLTAFSSFGQTFFISIWGGEIRQAFDLSHGDFGLIYMVATLASAATLPFIGHIVDIFSVRTTALIVIIMLTLACLSMSAMTSVLWLLLTIYLLRLFGQGMMTHTAITAMGRWYSANRGKAVSLTSVGHQFGEAFAPMLFVAIGAYLGWRSAWAAAGILLIGIALPLIWLLMRVERIPRSQSVAENTKHEVGRQWTRNEMLCDPLFWLVGVGVFSPAFIGTSIFFHQDYLIELNGWDRWLYDSSFALMAAVTVVTSLLTGWAIDRWSAAQLLPSFMMPLGFACLVLGGLSHSSAIVIFMALLGTSYGISSALFGSLWPEIYGTRHLGSLRAIIVSFMVFMSAAGPGVTGMLIDFGMPFADQLIYMGVFCFICVFLMSIASRGYRKRIAI